MNDTMLKLEYRVITEEYNDLDSSFGDINIIRYYNIYLSRSIGYKEYEVYNICTIPADIEAGGIFATGSSDLTSEVMLFGIYRLFNEGRLLHQYIPPYRIEYMYEGTLEYSYIKTEIHFNQYYDSKMWIPLYETTKEDFINIETQALDFEIRKDEPVSTDSGIEAKKVKHIILPKEANKHIIEILLGSFWQRNEIDLSEIPEAYKKLEDLADRTRKKLEYFRDIS
jgi:hypothetical protein